MKELKALWAELGFRRIETYIASGNVVFDFDETSERIQRKLEKRLRAFARKPVGVFVRSAAERQIVLKCNPFHAEEPKHTYVLFLNEAANAQICDDVRGHQDEEIRLGGREI